MKQFRVLHICDYAAPYRGNFIDSLESLEIYNNVENFYLFPARANGSAAKEWIEALNQNRKKAYIQETSIIKNIKLVRNILKNHKIDRIVRHFSDGKIDIVIKLLFKGKNVIRFFHCPCERRKNPIKHLIVKFFWRKNKLVGVSEAVTKEIRAAYPKFASFTIENAIHFNRLDKIDEIEKHDGVSLLMMGWNCFQKGVDLAIKAASALQKKYNIMFRIVGGINENKVKELVKEICGEDVDWIRYLPPTNNIGTYYMASDIFMSPSRWEAFGYANIEAVYCKNSVVLSKIDGQGQLKIDGAYWFESENVEDFTQKLEIAILELKLTEKIAQKEKAKEQVERIYSLKVWSERLVALF